jgi:hypothetical protein
VILTAALIEIQTNFSEERESSIFGIEVGSQDLYFVFFFYFLSGSTALVGPRLFSVS